MKKISFWLALLIVAGVVWAGVITNRSGPELRMDFLDVGQGDAIYLSMPDGRDALVDGGPNDRVLTELGEVMPYWDRDLDLVIVTHNHSDHISGLIGVLKRYKVGEIWISGAIHTSDQYVEMLKIIRDKHIKTRIVKVGDEKNFDEVGVRVVYPEVSFLGEKPEDQHEADVVTRWSYGKFTLLLTGDLSKEQVDDLAGSSEVLKSEVLKVPHHGSATGLSQDLLDRIKPSVAVIEVGFHNKFGHPKKTTLNLLKKNEIKVYRTDLDSRVEMVSDGVGFRLK